MKRYATLVLVAITLFLAFLPIATFADETQPRFRLPNPVIKIPGVSNFTEPPTGPCPAETGAVGVGQNCIFFPWIGQYLSSIYTFAIYAASILAAIVLAVAGFIWLTAAGNTTRIEQAKNYASGALFGLVLILGSYTVLYIVNPDLVTFKSLAVISIKNEPLPQVSMIKGAGFCTWQDPQVQINSQTFENTGNACPDFSLDVTGSPPSKCTGEPKRGQACCCKPIQANSNGTDPGFQKNIERQMQDASVALSALIDCIQGQIPITINSISDSKIVAGTCRPWECISKGKGSCQHACSANEGISAHYGGRDHTLQSINDEGYSCAVDISNTMPYAEFKRIAETICHASYTKDETNLNHYHASVSGCGAD